MRRHSTGRGAPSGERLRGALQGNSVHGVEHFTREAEEVSPPGPSSWRASGYRASPPLCPRSYALVPTRRAPHRCSSAKFAPKKGARRKVCERGADDGCQGAAFWAVGGEARARAASIRSAGPLASSMR